MNFSTMCRSLMIAIPESLPCAYLIAERFYGPLTTYATRYMILVIAVDRYMRIKHLQDYQVNFTRFRYRVMLGVYVLSVLYTALSYGISNAYNQSKWILRITTPVNVIGLILFITFYLKSVIMLKQHMRSNRSLSNTNHDILKITKFYFILYSISSVSILITAYISSIVNSQNEKLLREDNVVIFLMLNNLNATLTGIATSLATLKINRTIKAKLSTWIERISQSLLGQIQPDENPKP